MPDPAAPCFLSHFSMLRDPRQAAKVLYPLPEILLLLLCATVAGADDFAEIERWGVENLTFLRHFLRRRHGVPSHDTVGRGDRRARPRVVQRLLHCVDGRLCAR